MQERQVTIGKETFPVPDPFLVLATQNPIESDGTYQLPEAQLDRFMLKVVVDYPSLRDEIVVVERVVGPPIQLRPLLTPESLRALQAAVDEVYLDPHVIAYGARLVEATRRPADHKLAEYAPAIAYGASPRASINLALGARALAFLRGRRYALPIDMADLAHEVLRHRISLTYEGLADGVSPDAIVKAVIDRYPPPEMQLGHLGGRDAA
jgi:MoxR-like ATPase